MRIQFIFSYLICLTIAALLPGCQTAGPQRPQGVLYAPQNDVEKTKRELKHALQEKYFVRGAERNRLLAEAKRALCGESQGRNENLLQLLKTCQGASLSDESTAAAYYLLSIGFPAYAPPNGPEELKTFGIAYDPDPANRLVDPPLLVLAEHFTHTPWGQKGFIDLLNSPVESDYRKESVFPDLAAHNCFAEVVVQQIPRFLNENPDTPFRLEARYSLALAYDTLWCLSTMPDAQLDALGLDFTVVRSGYFAQQGPAARDNAIRLYQEIAREYPASLEAKYIYYVLPPLQASKDTGARYYFRK